MTPIKTFVLLIGLFIVGAFAYTVYVRVKCLIAAAKTKSAGQIIFQSLFLLFSIGTLVYVTHYFKFI